MAMRLQAHLDVQPGCCAGILQRPCHSWRLPQQIIRELQGSNREAALSKVGCSTSDVPVLGPVLPHGIY